MRSLFFRIFISFWLAMAVILASAIGLTATVAWYRLSKLSNINAAELIDSAATTLRDNGITGLKSWLQQIVNDHTDLDIYVIDGSGKDMLERPLPERIARWLVLGGRPTREGVANRGYNWPYGYDFSPGGITVHSYTFNRSHLLANPTILAVDGTPYTFIVAWFGATPVDVLGSTGIPLAIFAIALAVSAAVCWWIARYISAPVSKLQVSARTLALGNLNARVDRQFCERRDEIGILAQDFNQMAERLRSQIESKETLLRDVSHELRSPLTRLRVALGLAQRGDGDMGLQLGRIERDLERLDELIEEMLQLSRLSVSIPSIDFESIEVNRLLEDIAEDAQLEAHALGKSVTFEKASSDLPVCGNAMLLRRAIDNVLRNALRYCPAGDTVEISARCIEAGATVAVRDHGPGVPNESLTKIFEAFYRVAAGRERTTGGVGLGLAITARIMALHGGRVEARNAAERGLIVELWLPLSAQPENVTADYHQIADAEPRLD